MRRSDKAIKDPREIDALLHAAPVCRIAMASGGHPYMVPVNFAVDGGHLYFHSAKSGSNRSRVIVGQIWDCSPHRNFF